MERAAAPGPPLRHDPWPCPPETPAEAAAAGATSSAPCPLPMSVAGDGWSFVPHGSWSTSALRQGSCNPFVPTARLSWRTCTMPRQWPWRASKPKRNTGPMPASFPNLGNNTLAVGCALACGGPASSRGNARPACPRASSPFGRGRPTRRRRASVPQVLVTAHAGHRHLRVRQRRPVDVLVGSRP